MIIVNNFGYDSKHIRPMDRYCPNGHADYVLLLIKTEVFFENNGQITNMPPNTVMLYDKFTYVHYGCTDPHYNDDWLYFDLQGSDTDLLQKLDIPLSTPIVLPYMGTLTDYSRLIVTEKLSTQPYRDEIVDSLMHSLLYALAAQLHTVPDKNSRNKYYHTIRELRMELLNAPYKDWNVKELAGQVHISTSYFQLLYKKFFGTTCIQDLITARIKHAKYYLSTTEMSIQMLAPYCGYDNELHFMRQFKKITGMTPSQYRAMHRQQNKNV